MVLKSVTLQLSDYCRIEALMFVELDVNVQEALAGIVHNVLLIVNFARFRRDRGVGGFARRLDRENLLRGRGLGDLELLVELVNESSLKSVVE